MLMREKWMSYCQNLEMGVEVDISTPKVSVWILDMFKIFL